jgi:hypothetical protein
MDVFVIQAAEKRTTYKADPVAICRLAAASMRHTGQKASWHPVEPVAILNNFQ